MIFTVQLKLIKGTFTIIFKRINNHWLIVRKIKHTNAAVYNKPD